MKLDQVLLQKGLCDKTQVEQAHREIGAQASPTALGEWLLRHQHLSAAQWLEALSAAYDLPFVSEFDPAWLQPRLIEKLPVDWARTHSLLPVERESGLFALTSNPDAVSRLDELSLLLGSDLYPLLTTAEELQRAIDTCYSQRQAPQWANAARAGKPSEEIPLTQTEDLLRSGDEAPVAQYVSGLLLDAVRRRASDIHVEPFESKLQVRFRVDGFLYAQPPPPKSLELALISRLKVMARLDIAERRLPQDGMAKVRIGAREFDIRVSTVPVAEGERVVLRLLNQESLVRPLSALGMSGPVEADFRRVLSEPNGVILVTGPTGSGKTTTLYAALQGLDTEHLNVMTIEDPIEYQLPGIAQIQVKPKIGLTFAQGLRHILRQDPDVILVGEIRDAETAEIAIRASLTGHLVFSTLHTNDALSAVVRLLDMGIPAYLLASALRGCLAQRLVRQLCTKCRKASIPTQHELRALGSRAREMDGKIIWRPVGCSECMGGYCERVGVYEWLHLGPDWEATLRADSDGSALRKRVQELNVASLLDDGLDKVWKGLTSLEEILRVVGSAPQPTST
ncbi:MAG: Flp pilus assembly complex ATPase component TadA [Kiritimatiellae bacterium]|nr:Flp pilus assembly complex ATPase component TadA [Kiritimatiellia bacterium]